MLSGIVLCHHERGYFHHIKITLTVSEQTAEISISLKPDMQKFISMREQLEAFSFGAHEEEKDLLQSYEHEKFKLKRERDYYYKLLSALNTNIREYLGNDYINFKNWLQKS